MANNISDVKVNIAVEDVINPAAFGGICLYYAGDGTPLPYAEAYSYDEAKQIITSSDMLDTMGAKVNFENQSVGTIPKATLDAINSNYAFKAKEYTVEKNAKTIRGTSYNLRVKAITDNNGIDITLTNSHTYIGVACVGSTAGKEVTVMLKDSNGNILDSRIVTGDKAEYITLDCSDVASLKTVTLCSTSNVGGTLHVYAIEQLTMGKPAQLMLEAVETVFMQEDAPEKVGLLGCEVDEICYYINNDWRYLIEIGTCSYLNILGAAKYIEICGAKKVFGAIVRDNSVSGHSDGITYSDYLKYVYNTVKDYERTFIFVVHATDVNGVYALNNVAAALVAKTSSKAVGSYTYKNQSLKGLNADLDITKSALTDYHAHGCNAYVHKTGYDVTSEGKLVNGEYIDILDAKDWIVTQIEYRTQQALITNDKVPYTNTGIDYLASICVDVLNEAYNNGMINTTDDGLPDYSVNYAPRSETKASDREQRRYVEGKFSFSLAGAIHEVEVNGTILI